MDILPSLVQKSELLLPYMTFIHGLKLQGKIWYAVSVLFILFADDQTRCFKYRMNALSRYMTSIWPSTKCTSDTQVLNSALRLWMLTSCGHITAFSFGVTIYVCSA